MIVSAMGDTIQRNTLKHPPMNTAQAAAYTAAFSLMP